MANIENEKIVVREMIRIYCAKNHGANLCDACQNLMVYADRRLDSCGYGTQKPRCKKCQTHCYATREREQIRHIMQQIGPRMILHMPLRTLRYFIRRKK